MTRVADRPHGDATADGSGPGDWYAVNYVLVDSGNRPGAHLEEIVMLRIQDVSSVRWRDDDAYHHRAIAALDRRVASFDCPAAGASRR